MDAHSIDSQQLEERRQHSEAVVGRLRNEFSKISSAQAIPGLTIFCAGSYGRLEANDRSDLDIFFLVREPGEWRKQHTTTHHLFSDTINILEEVGLPELTDDGLYLKIHRLPCVLKHLGAPRDDSSNQFTTRMLMLLEGRWLYGEEQYKNSVADIIHSYYRDYPDHSQEFRPTFLINDISRFWKTLLLNYEHKRNQKPDDRARLRAKLKNYKLKFSRMTICYATIASIAAHDRALTEEDIRVLVQSTPFERLDAAVARVSSFAPVAEKAHIEKLSHQVSELQTQYSSFLQVVGKPDHELDEIFGNRDEKVRLFGEADRYRTGMLDLLDHIDILESVHFKVKPALLI